MISTIFSRPKRAQLLQPIQRQMRKSWKNIRLCWPHSPRLGKIDGAKLIVSANSTKWFFVLVSVFLISAVKLVRPKPHTMEHNDLYISMNIFQSTQNHLKIMNYGIDFFQSKTNLIRIIVSHNSWLSIIFWLNKIFSQSLRSVFSLFYYHLSFLQIFRRFGR